MDALDDDRSARKLNYKNVCVAFLKFPQLDRRNGGIVAHVAAALLIKDRRTQSALNLQVE